MPMTTRPPLPRSMPLMALAGLALLGFSAGAGAAWLTEGTATASAAGPVPPSVQQAGLTSPAPSTTSAQSPSSTAPSSTAPTSTPPTSTAPVSSERLPSSRRASSAARPAAESAPVAPARPPAVRVPVVPAQPAAPAPYRPAPAPAPRPAPPPDPAPVPPPLAFDVPLLPVNPQPVIEPRVVTIG